MILILMMQEMIGLWDGISIGQTICKQSASRSTQITTTPHHSIFTGRMLFLTTNQQASKSVKALKVTTSPMSVNSENQQKQLKF